MRELAGPPGAPTALLLHGWTATADLNWFRCYEALARHFRVVSFDLRGHGVGIRSRRPFRLDDCADDAIAVADALGIDKALMVGYSMGGALAQLVWRRHPRRVQGLVLCSTADHFSASREERLNFFGLAGLAALARVTPSTARRWLTEQLYLQRKVGAWEPWALHEASKHDWRMVLEAGWAIGGFDSRRWVDEVDVPTSVVITMRDRIVPVRRQLGLHDAIRGSRAFRVDGGHDAAVVLHDKYVPTLLDACDAAAGASR